MKIIAAALLAASLAGCATMPDVEVASQNHSADQPSENSMALEESLQSWIPEPMIYAGKGDSIVVLGHLEDAVVFYIAGNAEETPFRVEGLDANGEVVKVLVETEEPYAGTTIDPTLATKALQITAVGDWLVEVQSVYTIRTVSQFETISGAGDEVLMVESSGGNVTIEGNEAEKQFVVTSYGSVGNDRMIETQEWFLGDVPVKNDPILLEIIATGDWSLRFY